MSVSSIKTLHEILSTERVGELEEGIREKLSDFPFVRDVRFKKVDGTQNTDGPQIGSGALWFSPSGEKARVRFFPNDLDSDNQDWVYGVESAQRAVDELFYFFEQVFDNPLTDREYVRERIMEGLRSHAEMVGSIAGKVEGAKTEISATFEKVKTAMQELIETSRSAYRKRGVPEEDIPDPMMWSARNPISGIMNHLKTDIYVERSKFYNPVQLDIEVGTREGNGTLKVRYDERKDCSDTSYVRSVDAVFPARASIRVHSGMAVEDHRIEQFGWVLPLDEINVFDFKFDGKYKKYGDVFRAVISLSRKTVMALSGKTSCDIPETTSLTTYIAEKQPMLHSKLVYMLPG
ncbi:hypothetical protein KY360_01930 [Candidatus Woesearchaeota archaeon]|nr:hypothetical protein [Candidatus Woesearchaeota archaeon]